MINFAAVMEENNMAPSLDAFQQTLEDGLIKICSMDGLASGMLPCEDIDGRWDALVKDYVADAVENFNDWPNAALGFAAYLGMAVASQWDKDWAHYRNKNYKSYYGSRGFDDMDDHIARDVLKLDDEAAARLSQCILACSEATLGLIKHEGVETETRYGFFVLVRCYTAMFRIGATIELTRRGYKLEKI